MVKTGILVSLKVRMEVHKFHHHHHIPWLSPPRGVAVIKEEKLRGSNSKKLYTPPLSLSDDSQDLLKGRGFLVPSPKEGLKNPEENVCIQKLHFFIALSCYQISHSKTNKLRQSSNQHIQRPCKLF